MSDRCTGHCCRSVILPLSPAQLIEEFEAALVGDGDPIQDIAIIAPMLELSTPHAGDPELTGPFWTYRCRNLQPNGDCGIYDRRPQMCRGYPYGEPCRYATCTWDAVRANPASPRRAVENTVQ